MMEKAGRLVIILLLAVRLGVCAYAVAPEASNEYAASFNEGCASFRTGDWNSAMMLFRRAVLSPQYDTEGTWYMLILSEMNGGAGRQAADDCDTFLAKFPSSPYCDVVQYQKGRALYLVGDYDNSALLLSDFCHQYPLSPLYAPSLFYAAESLFALSRLDEAMAIYTRIVNEFADCGKVPEARHRLDEIAGRKREAMLLYLLKKTGEEYAASKEEYERQLRQYDNSKEGM